RILLSAFGLRLLLTWLSVSADGLLGHRLDVGNARSVVWGIRNHALRHRPGWFVFIQDDRLDRDPVFEHRLADRTYTGDSCDRFVTTCLAPRTSRQCHAAGGRHKHGHIPTCSARRFQSLGDLSTHDGRERYTCRILG